MHESDEVSPFARLGRKHLIALDGLLALEYAVVLVATVLARQGGWPECLLAAGIALPLSVRRVRPRAVFGTVTALSVLAVSLDLVGEPFFAAAFALYTVALTSPGRVRVTTRAILVAGVVGAVVLPLLGLYPAPEPGSASLFPVGAIALGLAWTLGQVVRERRTHAAAAARRVAEQAVTGERLRIARELHDVVTHGVGLIAVRAGVAHHALRSRPDADPEVRAALADIETAGRTALAEMRRMLGVLRPDREHAEDGRLRPQPGLADLADLAGMAEKAGVAVELDVRDTPPLTPGLELTAYRIVQEALTNVVKHAAPTRCEVTVRAGAGDLRIDVVDGGTGRGGGAARRGSEGGKGLIGIQERVLMYQGGFTAGPRRGGGFAVSVRLPLTSAVTTSGRNG
ncbi:sensor histidine kinase [Saccharothrix australiensis]|uniref:histidine kinase n=1 Tax=Saccharothrix australiensis TaxID=2072 RepID=A0A495W4T4_9PSEU|nr:histidine kinase [Saccharothrix australiensis]RKT55785.1 signal transduction histidine kinase [Saccharothrix australiensis]